MRTAGMDCQVTVERKSVTQDTTYGTDVVTWVPLSILPGSPEVAERFWAEVMDAVPSRAESSRGGMQLAANQARLRMRYRDDIDSSMRVTVHRDGDVVYQIIGGPAMLGRKEKIELVLERYSS